MYEIGDKVVVNDLMQTDYEYRIDARYGADFDKSFLPHFTPKEMLKFGVFEGKYCNDCHDELPEDWFTEAKTSAIPCADSNFFKTKSRQSLQVWQNKGWIVDPDVRGWFQWYCRYYLGRRIPEIDAWQITRWRAFSRHAGQIRANCDVGNLDCRPRQRQALLQWSYDPFI